jgi:hypothetical protein
VADWSTAERHPFAILLGRLRLSTLTGVSRATDLVKQLHEAAAALIALVERIDP